MNRCGIQVKVAEGPYPLILKMQKGFNFFNGMFHVVFSWELCTYHYDKYIEYLNPTSSEYMYIYIYTSYLYIHIYIVVCIIWSILLQMRKGHLIWWYPHGSLEISGQAWSWLLKSITRTRSLSQSSMAGQGDCTIVTDWWNLEPILFIYDVYMYIDCVRK